MRVVVSPQLRLLAAAAGCAGVLVVTSATPAGAVRAAQDGFAFATGPDPFAGVVATAALLAWLLVAWLATTVLLTAVGQVPGAVGRCATAAARAVAPAAVRRAVELALGLGLAAGVATSAGPASAAPLAGVDTATPAAAAGPARRQVPSLDWPSTTRPAPAPAPAATVVVAAGDTLWSVAARALGPSATTQQVAAAWPAWWAANRDVVGADPHLIRPGTRLTPPVAQP